MYLRISKFVSKIMVQVALIVLKKYIDRSLLGFRNTVLNICLKVWDRCSVPLLPAGAAVRQVAGDGLYMMTFLQLSPPLSFLFVLFLGDVCV